MKHTTNTILGRKLAELEKRAEIEKVARITLADLGDVVIKMDDYLRRENPPHVHVWCDNIEFRIKIRNGEPARGSPTPKPSHNRKIKDWLDLHRTKLLVMWDDRNPYSYPPTFF